MSAQLAAAAAQSFSPSGPTGEKAKSLVLVLIVVVVLGLVVFAIVKAYGSFSNFIKTITGIGTGLTDKLHITDTPEEAAARKKIEDTKESASDSASAWSQKYYQTVPAGAALVTKQAAIDICKQIRDSVGYINDDPEKGFGAIKKCPSKAAVSWVCKNFNDLYASDLFTWLKIKYDTREQAIVLAQIIDYVNQLKKY